MVIESKDGISWRRMKTGRRRACVPLTPVLSGVSAIQEGLTSKGFAWLRSSGLFPESFWKSSSYSTAAIDSAELIYDFVDSQQKLSASDRSSAQSHFLRTGNKEVP